MTIERRWLRRSLGAAVAVLLVAGAASAYLLQGPRAFTVDDAVEDFRAAAVDGHEPGAPEAAAPSTTTAVASEHEADQGTVVAASGGQVTGEPDPTVAPAATPSSAAAQRQRIAGGVYRYRTDGYEATDALNGMRHDYPDESPITVRHTDCGGFVQRWRPLAERWDESDFCVDETGVSIRRFTTRHEFFKQRQTDEFLCPAGTYVYRSDTLPGDTWSWTCESANSTFATAVTYIGETQLTVGGEAVPAAHYRYDSTMAGATRGTQLQERWVDPHTGLLLKMTTDIDTEADSPFGTVGYEEHYVLTLTAAEPHR